MSTKPTYYRIARWSELYEPTTRERRGVGPLRYVRWWVHAHGLGHGWRLLQRIAGKGAAGKWRAVTLLGLFGKLLEWAADEPASTRDGVIYTHRGVPATADEIAGELDAPSERVKRGLDDLIRCGWVEEFGATTVRTAARCGATTVRTVPETEDTPRERAKNGCAHNGGAAARRCVPETETETETELNLTETETTGEFQPHFKERARIASVSVSKEDLGTIQARTRQVIAARLFAGALPGGSQGRADNTTLRSICEHVIKGPTPEEAEQQTSSLKAHAQQAQETKRPIATFIRRVKAEWGTWPGHGKSPRTRGGGNA